MWTTVASCWRKKNPNQVVSDKILGSVTVNTFEPDLYETIDVVHEFDQTLKFVTFDVTREADGCDDPNNNTCHKKRKEMHLMWWCRHKSHA